MSEQPPKRGFLIMPFKSEFEWIKDDVIAAGLDVGVEIDRADDIFSPGVILDQIFAAIDGAHVVVAVCTGRNANVFFELGFAWRHHDPILIAESTDDLPFDIQHFRAVMYGGPAADQHPRTLRARVRRALRAVLDEARLPRGQRLLTPPAPKQAARLSAQLTGVGSSQRLILSNSGTMELHNVNVDVPDEATSFGLLADGLPIDTLRPGEQVKFPVSVTMGGGPRIFDIQLGGETADGDHLTFPTKISL